MIQANDFATVKRPRILVKAAKIAASHYNRDKTLRRIIKCAVLPPNGKALRILSDIESQLNTQRIDGEASYSMRRHINVLAALLIEKSFLRVA